MTTLTCGIFLFSIVSVVCVLVASASVMDGTAAATTSPPKSNSHQRTRETLTLICSVLSMIAIIFCVLQYAHYKHLHSAGNHVFIGILLFNFLDNLTYFVCIFFVEETKRFEKQRCDACGFFEQVYSFAEPCFQIAFWAAIYLIVSGSVIRFKQRFAVWVFGFVVPGAVLTACLALALDMYSGEGQTWCWVDSQYTWFRIAFSWSQTGIAVLLACGVSLRPFTYWSVLIPTQRSALLRRSSLALVLSVVFAIDLLSSSGAGWLSLQAVINPLDGFLNVLAFLWSERMLGLAALGLPPGADPPYGFTAAVQDIPERVSLVPGSRESGAAGTTFFSFDRAD